MIPAVRELMKDVIPEGVNIDALTVPRTHDPVVRPATWLGTHTGLAEGPGDLGKLLTDLTSSKLGAKPDLVTEKTLADYISQQSALKDEYRQKLTFLLSLAEDKGPSSRKQIVDNFRSLIGDAYQQSFLIGLHATSSGVKQPDGIMSKNLKREADNEVKYFTKFLDAIWNDEEVLPRDTRSELYVDALDSLFSMGALTGTPYKILVYWKLSPAEHCIDCLTLAANSPYAKPGDGTIDLDPLPTVPRRGDTQCISNCKCYLEYVKEDDPDTHYEPRARTGASIQPKPADQQTEDDPETIDPEDPDIVNAQKEADQIEEDLAYYKSMYELTGDPEYRQKRQELLAREVELQDSLGVRIVPKTTADAMVEVMRKAQDEGYDPILPNAKFKATEGMEVGYLRGNLFERGYLTSYENGKGTFENLAGQERPVSVFDDQPSILFVPGGKDFINKPWSIIQQEDPTRFWTQVPGYQASYAEGFGFNECGMSESLKEAPGFCYARTGLAALRSILDDRPRTETFGVQVLVAGQSEDTGYTADGKTLTYANVFNNSAVTQDDADHAMREGIGTMIFRESLTGDQKTEFRSLLDASDNARAYTSKWLLEGETDESAFSAVYALFLEQPEQMKDDDPEMLAFIERTLSKL